MARAVNPEFLTAAQAARMLNIPTTKFRDLVAANVLPPASHWHRSIGYECWDREMILRIVRGETAASGVEGISL